MGEAMVKGRGPEGTETQDEVPDELCVAVWWAQRAGADSAGTFYQASKLGVHSGDEELLQVLQQTLDLSSKNNKSRYLLRAMC